MDDQQKFKKILFVFGTRPEAIKIAPLILECRKPQYDFQIMVCVTGQHREMMDQVLRLFDITPDYDLNIMQKGQDLYDITSRVLLGMRPVLSESKPDLVFVHGDTSTSTAAALAAFYQQIPVAHIEAGLRTGNIYSPWPEEMNRQITSRLSTYHFAPTAASRSNLLAEAVQEKVIFITGNTVIDALFSVLDKIRGKSELKLSIINELVKSGIREGYIRSWESKERKLVLITGHRRENFGQGFIDICEAIKSLAIKFPDTDFIYPMHLNPNVRNAISEVFGKVEGGQTDGLQNTFFIEPLDYLPFVFLMSSCYLILTDSGGVQEEAPSLGKPVLVMRNTTERPEAIEAGTVKLVGTDKEMIIREVSTLIENVHSYGLMSKNVNPYGDGFACKRIAEIISNQ